jgi:hypothetical protein
VEFYWEGWQFEPVSPELALVDPVLRERLLAQPVVLPAPPMPDPPLGGRQIRRSDIIAWTSFAASCATVLALVTLARFQHPRHTPPTPSVGPVVALVTTYTPPAAPIDQRSDAEKRELAALLRSPMRDPFSR